MHRGWKNALAGGRGRDVLPGRCQRPSPGFGAPHLAQGSVDTFLLLPGKFCSTIYQIPGCTAKYSLRVSCLPSSPWGWVCSVTAVPGSVGAGMLEVKGVSDCPLAKPARLPFRRSPSASQTATNLWSICCLAPKPKAGHPARAQGLPTRALTQ